MDKEYDVFLEDELYDMAQQAKYDEWFACNKEQLIEQYKSFGYDPDNEDEFMEFVKSVWKDFISE